MREATCTNGEVSGSNGFGNCGAVRKATGSNREVKGRNLVGNFDGGEAGNGKQQGIIVVGNLVSGDGVGRTQRGSNGKRRCR